MAKMGSIVQDRRNFMQLHGDTYAAIIKLEDKNNRLVDSLKKSGVIDESTARNLRACGSRPGILFGSPKVHKRDVPMRPVISTVGSVSYGMSQWLVQLLAPLDKSEFIV